MTAPKRGRVTLGGFVTVDAVWDDEERWNGWLCPRVTKYSADKVMEALVNDPYAEPNRLSYAWEGKVLVVSDQYGLAPGEVQYDRYAPDEDGLYALGSYAWTWSAAD